MGWVYVAHAINMLRYCQYHAILICLGTNQQAMDNIQLLTRKNATCQDLLTCLYNLKPIDTEIFFQVTTTQNATIDKIAKTVHRDRSSIHRCLQKLVTANLVYKQTKTIKGGGYYHIYIAAEPEKIKQDARRKVTEITLSLEKLIDNFGSPLNSQ